MEGEYIRFINLTKIDYIRELKVGNSNLVKNKADDEFLTKIQIFQNGKNVFDFDFKTKEKANMFCDKVYFSFKDNLLFNPIKVIIENNLDK